MKVFLMCSGNSKYSIFSLTRETRAAITGLLGTDHKFEIFISFQIFLSFQNQTLYFLANKDGRSDPWSINFSSLDQITMTSAARLENHLNKIKF